MTNKGKLQTNYGNMEMIQIWHTKNDTRCHKRVDFKWNSTIEQRHYTVLQVQYEDNY